MSKQELIDSIRRHNPTAHAEFLTGFDEQALDRYLNHLLFQQRPRGSCTIWVRPAETTAVTTRQR
jgi:hypothetical protein